MLLIPIKSPRQFASGIGPICSASSGALGVCAVVSLALLTTSILARSAVTKVDTSEEGTVATTLAPSTATVTTGIPASTEMVTTSIPASTETVTTIIPASTETVTIVEDVGQIGTVTITETSTTTETSVSIQVTSVFVTAPP